MMSTKTKTSSSNQEHPKKILTREHGKSQFHVPMPAPSCSECLEGLQSIVCFTDNLKQMCGAGTHAADRISSLLVGTSYQEIAGQFLVLQQHLDGAMDSVVSQIKGELEVCIKRLGRDEVDTNGKTDGNSPRQGHKPEDLQVLAMGLVLMLQLQQQFFITATEKLACFSQSHALNNTNGMTVDPKLLSTSIHGNSHQMSPGQPGHPVASRAASDPECHGRCMPNTSSHDVESVNVSPNPSEGRPSGGPWNADNSKANREAGSSQDAANHETLSAGQMIGHRYLAGLKGQDQGHGTSAGRSNPGIHLPNGTVVGSGGVTAGGVTAGGSVSEEEIDVVIQMLSRATKYLAPTGGEQLVKVAPQNCHTSMYGTQPMVAAISKAPGSHLPVNNHNGAYVLSPSMAGTKEQLGFYSHRAAQHRQSDGFIMESHVTADNKTNTWPFRPRQKESGPSWPGVDYSQSNLYAAHGVYDTMGCPDVAYGLPPGVKPALIPCFNPGPWGTTPDGGANKAWPVFPNMADGEGAPRQWSAMADSSSCSDESSSNSEVQWMMGLHMMDAMNMKRRRHSSGGEEMAGTGGGPTNNINKSVDSLMEPKLTNTWPPKHPWGSKGNDEQSGCDSADFGGSKVVHRPLMPQWSDPLATRPLAVWDTGVIGNLSQQSFGSLSTGGAAYTPANAIGTREEEKHF